MQNKLYRRFDVRPISRVFLLVFFKSSQNLSDKFGKICLLVVGPSLRCFAQLRDVSPQRQINQSNSSF